MQCSLSHLIVFTAAFGLAQMGCQKKAPIAATKPSLMESHLPRAVPTPDQVIREPDDFTATHSLTFPQQYSAINFASETTSKIQPFELTA